MHHLTTSRLTLVAALLAFSAQTPQPAAPPAMVYFLGTWSCQGHFSNGKPIGSTVSFATDMQGSALVKHHDDAPALGKYHAIEVWVYDANAKLFNVAIADNFGGVRSFSSPGWNGDTVVFTSSPGIKPPQQFLYTKKSADVFVLDWLVARDGTHYVMGDTLTCSRSPRTTSG